MRGACVVESVTMTNRHMAGGQLASGEVHTDWFDAT